MPVHIEEKPEPAALNRNQLRKLVAYKAVEVPAEDRLKIKDVDLGDVVVVLASDYRSELFNATKEALVFAHSQNADWRGYKFRRARYVRSIQLTFDVDED